MAVNFISFEGPEGAGKSTQVSALATAFKQAGLNVVTTREPGGTVGAESIRELLVNGDITKWDATTELLLHLAARNDHVNKFVKPMLAAGKFVICDRFADSTIAYQAYAHGLGEAFVNQMCNLVLGNFQPQLTLILDLKIEDSINRTMQREKGLAPGIARENRYEKMGVDFHQKVRHGFLEIAKLNPQRCVVINANSAIASLHAQIIATINNKLGLSLLPVLTDK